MSVFPIPLFFRAYHFSPPKGRNRVCGAIDGIAARFQGVTCNTVRQRFTAVIHMFDMLIHICRCRDC